MRMQIFNNYKNNYILSNEGLYREIKNFIYETYNDSFDKNNTQSLFINYFDLDNNIYINLLPKKEFDFNSLNNKDNLLLIKYDIIQM